MILVNGKGADVISVYDRGFLYGHGLFETIAVIQGRPRYLQRHLDRLASGCDSIGITMPPVSLLEHEIDTLIDASKKAVLKIILSAGVGKRGYKSPDPMEVTRILQLSDYPCYPDEYAVSGINVCVCKTRLSENSTLAGIKHLCRLEQVMARNEWQDPGITEGLMLNQHGHVIEGTMTNLFMVKDGVLYTPDISQSGVAGIMRSVILDRAATHDIETRVTTITLEDVASADELFVCNSIVDIWPVRQIDGQGYHVGPITKKLRAILHE